jgi:hypothetical protein
MGHCIENKGLGDARPQRMKTNIWKEAETKAVGGRGEEKTYVANEKLGASIFEGNVTTVWGYGRGGLLNNGVYFFTSGWMYWEGRGRI